jgi:hypothetical protein
LSEHKGNHQHADPCGGVVVSTAKNRGHVYTGDFPSDDVAVQYGYDLSVTDRGFPRTLVLDAAERPFRFAGALDIWQSHCRVTSTGGVTIRPAEGYDGALITSARRPETELGEDDLITDVVLDHIWMNGENRSLGIKLKHIQLSTFHHLHVRNTNGPGLWLSDYCIENLFTDIVLSDECGSVEQPALLLEPEGTDPLPGMENNGNITVNSTRFSGIMIHFPTNACLEVGTGPAEVPIGRRQRKIQFTGCFFHAHGRQTRPLVTLAEAYELAFVGTQMLSWNDAGPVMQIGTLDARYPTGITLVSHCIFGSKPGSDAVGIEVVNADTNGPCLSVFGNSFGSQDRRLAHAVDWGMQQGKTAAWAANAVFVREEPHIGVRPGQADVSPFE